MFGSHCPEERQLSLDFVWFIFIQKQSVSRLSSVFLSLFDSVLSLPFALATVSGFHPPQCRCMWWILFLEERNVGGEKRRERYSFNLSELCLDACGRRQGSKDLLQLGHKVPTNSTNVVTTDSFHDSGDFTTFFFFSFKFKFSSFFYYIFFFWLDLV